MRALLFVLLMLAIFDQIEERTALAGNPVRCTTREDPQFQRLITECTGGARAITKYDKQFQRWRTDIVRAPKGDKPPRGWPVPGKGTR